MNKIISFGGGVNSVAMVIMLYKRGEIYPCVFADTMAEHPETYCYMDYFERSFMKPYGMRIIKLHPEKTPEWFSGKAKGRGLYEYCIKDNVIPFMKFRWCTADWKVKPILRYKQSYGFITSLVAFSYDEKHRAERSSRNDDIKEYPLIGEIINRKGCEEIIMQSGLQMPRKSGCFLCPFQRISQWQDLYNKYPELIEKTIYLEENARAKDGHRITLRPDNISIRQIRERFEAKGGELFPDYDYEELTPCMCIT